ncbi:MAG: adenylate kinase [Candidatus Hepatoplasma scabrum]|nr:MAG: adenylate kinase [Candidatus Hepatoplasma sp.]
MIYIFLGAPGTGKGTISYLLDKNKNYKHISTGNIFRELIKKNTKLAKEVRGILKKGELIDDQLTFKVLLEDIEKYNLKKDNIILDGYPRNINQAEILFEYFSRYHKDLKILVINFELRNKIIIERLTNRLICPLCGKSYHRLFLDLKPKKEWYCDNDKTKLIQREDDKIKSIKKRLVIYDEQTKPLIEYFSDKKILINLDANDSPTKIYEKVLKICQI